jgi:hypothetical protein
VALDALNLGRTPACPQQVRPTPVSWLGYSSSSSSYTLSPINMMNNRKNETAENNNAIKSTTAKEEKGSIFVIKLTAKRNGATA